jgi:N-formylglutamate amidohydrolase
MDKLPVAIVIPHAGLVLPPEVHGRLALTPEQIFNEADAYADQIFDFRDQVLHWITFPYARAILDMNRLDDPARTRPGDGIVKWQTSYGDLVYRPGEQPDEALERQLIARYWRGWHEQLAAIVADERVRVVIDAHSMAAVGPTLYGDPGLLRPRVDVANLGDEVGNVTEERGYISAPAMLAQALAEALGEGVGQLAAWTATGDDWALNRPFWGGADLWLHGRSPHHQPWLMVEINRALYIGQQDGNTPIVPPDGERITALRDCVWQAVLAVMSHGGHFVYGDG